MDGSKELEHILRGGSEDGWAPEAGSPEFIAKTRTQQNKEVEAYPKIEEPKSTERPPKVSCKRIFRYHHQLVTAYLTAPTPEEIEGANIVDVAGDPSPEYAREDKILSESGEWLISREGTFVVIPFAEPEPPPKEDLRIPPPLPEPAREFAPRRDDNLEYRRPANPDVRVSLGTGSDGWSSPRRHEGLRTDSHGVNHLLDWD